MVSSFVAHPLELLFSTYEPSIASEKKVSVFYRIYVKDCRLGVFFFFKQYSYITVLDSEDSESLQAAFFMNVLNSGHQINL